MSNNTGAVPGFLPSQQGFRFTNSFPSEPDITIDLGPAGKVGLGDASQGLCGGMAFALRDYVEAGLPVPDLASPPPRGTPLFDYLVSRLLDSFDLPVGVATYLFWMALPAADVTVLGIGERGTSSRTVLDTWPQVRADIDAGHLSPLGLVTVHTADVTQVGRCHQVLAYAYAVDASETLTLSVYDPNTAPAGADDVWIRLPLGNPGAGVTITHTVDIAEPTLHGFFRSAYSPRQPPVVPTG